MQSWGPDHFPDEEQERLTRGTQSDSERTSQRAQTHVPCNHSTWETEAGGQGFEVSLKYQQDSVLKM